MNKKMEVCAPLTSFDWNEKSPNVIGTASVDTTCTIWDVEKRQMMTQLIAHDKEVLDIAWSHRPELFGTAGSGDGLPFSFISVSYAFILRFYCLFVSAYPDMIFLHFHHLFFSQDGSIRMFDLRHLEHSTIIFETGPPDHPSTRPLLRLAWNHEVRDQIER